MGQAKQRGSFEQRRQAAVDRDAEHRAQAAAIAEGRRLLAEARERHRSSQPVQRFILPSTPSGRALRDRLLQRAGMGHLVTGAG